MNKFTVYFSFVAAIIAATLAYFTGENPVAYAVTIGLLAYASSWGIITLIIAVIIWKGSVGLTKLIFWR